MLKIISVFCFHHTQVVWTGCRRKSVPFLITDQRLSTDDIHDSNQHFSIEWLDLESSRACYLPPQHFPIEDKNTALILPNIPRQASQRWPRKTENKLEVIDLEHYRIETEFRRKDTRMESTNSTDDDKSDFQVSITEGVNQLSFNHHNNNDDEGFPDDEFSKSALFFKQRTSTCSEDNSMDQLKIIETAPKDLRHETTSNHVRADTPSNRDKGKFSLPPLMNTDGRRHTVHEVPSITVCQDADTRRSKNAEKDSVFDPRFLMPTEVRTTI